MTKVVLFTTGGTIASRKLTTGDDVVASVAGGSLLEAVRESIGNVEVVVKEFCNIGSFALTLEKSFELALEIDAEVADPTVAGIVVTHGIDTMEERAWLADLILSKDKPLVFTGAQRSNDIGDSDGPRNLVDAIKLASSEQVRGLGAMIVFEQDFHAARDVTKTHTSRVDTFTFGGTRQAWRNRR